MRGSRFRLWWLVLPALVTTAPHLGSFRVIDHKLWEYGVPADSGMSFWGTVFRVFGQLGLYLRRDANFRPVGRLLLDLEAWFSWEVAVVTGVPSHVVHGVWRVGLVVVLAWGVGRFVGLFLSGESFGVRVVPLVLAAWLVVDSANHGLLLFPVMAVTVAAGMLWVSVWVCGVDVLVGGGVRDGVLGVGLGVLAGFVYELLWLGPLVVLGVVLARWWRVGGWVELRRSVVFVRWFGYFVGTGVAVLVSKGAQWFVCVRDGFCGYEFNRVDVWEVFLGLDVVASRVLTGLPVVSYRRGVGSPLTVSEFFGNGFLVVLCGLLVLCAVRCVSSGGVGSGLGGGWRLVVAGLPLVVLPALAVTGSWELFEGGFGGVGLAWRDTLLVQLGWVFVVVGLVDVLVGWVRGRWGERWGGRVVVLVTVVVVALGWLTLGRNEGWSRVLRTEPGVGFPFEVASSAMVAVVDDPVHEVWRCELVGLGEGSADGSVPAVVYDMNRLSELVWGVPFCSESLSPSGGGVYLDVVGTRYEEFYGLVPDVGLVGPGCFSPVDRFACPGGVLRGVIVRHWVSRLVSHGFVDAEAGSRGLGYVLWGQNNVTRGELAGVLFELGGLVGGSPSGVFVDVGDVGVAGVVEAVWEAGLVEPCGVDPLRFCPDGLALREDLVFGVGRLGVVEGWVG